MIDWEQKTQLVKALNNDNYKEIEKFVENHIENFDCQAWDMLSFMPLIQNNYSKGFFDKIKIHYKKAYKIGLLDNLSMRAAIRLEFAFGDTDDKGVRK